MNRDQKTAAIEEISTQLQESSAVIAVDYRGISVPQVAALRTKLRDADATFSVVKNTLTQLAADKAGTAELKTVLVGPTALTFVRGDAAMAAKAIADFIKENEILEFKGGLMDGAAVSPDELKAISKLPSRDVLYGQLVGMIATPLNGLVRSLNGLVSGLAVQLQQIADQGLVGGDAPVEEAPKEDEAEAKQESEKAEAKEALAEEEAAEAADDEAEASTDAPEKDSDEGEGDAEAEVAPEPENSSKAEEASDDAGDDKEAADEQPEDSDK